MNRKMIGEVIYIWVLDRK